MSAAPSQSPRGDDRIPRLAPGCDPAALARTPAEGFLLSRIDGATPIRLLRQIGGLPPDEVGDCLERWAAEGAVTLEGPAQSAATPAPPAPAAGPACDAAAAAPRVDESAIDPSLDISEDVQRRILAFEALLERPYHEVLGVARDADTRTIKKAYFGLSKVFHPDRYFRSRTGPYQERIGRIWRRVLEAYELLSDPQTRAEVQREEQATEASPGTGPDLRMLRAHMRLFGRKPGTAQNPERARKARAFFDSGMAAFRAERWLEAAGSVRLALAFDPTNEEFKRAFVDVQQRAHEERAAVLSREADGALELREYRDALRLYEEAAHYRPCDAALNHKVAWLSLKLGEDLRRAKEYGVAACELEPECGEYHQTLGCIYRAAGMLANAKRELQRALELDPKCEKARQELKGL
jgi:curved DNA-binding protein CbpA